MNNGAVMAVVCVSSLPFGGKQTAVAISDSPNTRIILSDLKSPHSITAWSVGVSLVSDGTSPIVKITKGNVEPFITGLSSPRGLSADTRNGRLFVADGDTVKIFKLKHPADDPVQIHVPVTGYLNDVAYSIM